MFWNPFMQKLAAIFLLQVPLVFAQAPAITGVWKADLQKSKIAGPPISEYIEIVEAKTFTDRRTKETAPELDETIGTTGQRGLQRSTLSYLTNGKSSVRPYMGIPTRLTAKTENGTMTVFGEVAGRPDTFKRTYELSSDGQTLTISSVATNNGKEQQNTYVLTKQPDSAADALRKPEETAGQHFKNVKTDALKNVPESEFIDQMRYIAWSLNKNCEFCHVQGHFDADEKKPKETARKMLNMTASIDANNFDGHPAVRCFTCHEGHEHPLSRPRFPDEPEQPASSGPPPPTPTQQQH
jgi:hypothetical protein